MKTEKTEGLGVSILLSIELGALVVFCWRDEETSESYL